MKRILGIISIILFIANNVNGQKLMFGFQTGFGTYKMSDLRNINSDFKYSNIPFDTKLVSDFPAYWYYRPSVLLKFNKNSLGIIYTFQSTGSRVSAKDYSGEYRFDMTVNSHCLGLYAEGNIKKIRNYGINLYVTGGILYSNLKIIEYLEVFDTILTEQTIVFKALNWYIEPGLNLKYTYNQLLFGITAGYFITIATEDYYTGNNKQQKLYNTYSRTTVKPDWNGLRIGLFFTYFLSTDKNKNKPAK
jgi:hypothetical protein